RRGRGRGRGGRFPNPGRGNIDQTRGQFEAGPGNFPTYIPQYFPPPQAPAAAMIPAYQPSSGSYRLATGVPRGRGTTGGYPQAPYSTRNVQYPTPGFVIPESDTASTLGASTTGGESYNWAPTDE